MATEKVKKAPPSPLPGKIKALVAKAMAVKMPGNIPLPVFLGVFLGVFTIGTALMAYVSLKQIVRVRKQHMVSLPAATGTKKVDPHSAGSVAAVAASSATPVAANASSRQGNTSSVPAAVAPGTEMDNRTVSFLLHSYEEQKAQLALQEEKITRLENTMAAMGNKTAAPPSAVSAAPANAAIAAVPKKEISAPKKASPAPKTASPAPKKEQQPAGGSSDVKRLAELYTQMKPADVSAIIEDMDDGTLVRVFAHMKSKTVAKIISLMDPQRAAHISKKIAN